MHPDLGQLLPIVPGSATLRQWTRTHDYDVWTDCRPESDPPLALWEARGAGVVRVPDQATLMHVIPGGTAHHVEGLFGYWRQSDADIVWLRAARGEFVHHAMVLGGSPGAYKMDRILWICPACATVIARHEFATGPHQLERFWRGEREAIASFNNSSRACPRCGHVHPPAYGFRRDGADAAPALAW
jgi:ribosomal protein S27AE